jgi:ATP-dependent RNA helicase DDX54/DBP10
MLRKRTRHDTDASDVSVLDSSQQRDFSDDAVDISSALTGKKRKLFEQPEDLEDDDIEDFSRFVQESIVKRDIKNGTQVMKSIKGKQKVMKGEVGGGSFQSMGMLFDGLINVK